MRCNQIAASLLAALAAAACSSNTVTPKSCVNSADCPDGLFCDSQKVCAVALSNGGSGASATVSGSTGSGASTGAAVTSGGVASTNGGNGSTGGSPGTTGNANGGSVAGSTTGSAVGTTTGSGTTGAATILAGGLSFAVVGDSRPPSDCCKNCTSLSTCAYPESVIQQIYTGIASLSPVPAYVVGTGDFMENTPGYNTAAWQVSQYEAAVSGGGFTGQLLPAMGNHECTGVPSSECNTGPQGVTENYTAFLGMLSQVGITTNNGLAYYTAGPFTLATGQTVKFIQLAANAWDDTQAAWFDTQLSMATDYTFVARHEPDDATYSTPFVGITGSNAVMANHPGAVTMRLEGHTHELRWNSYSAVDGGSGEAIVGNGGAQPWDCTGTTNTIFCDYGYLLCQQRTDNTILCTPYAANGNVPAPAPIPFAVHPNGKEDYPAF